MEINDQESYNLRLKMTKNDSLNIIDEVEDPSFTLKNT